MLQSAQIWRQICGALLQGDGDGGGGGWEDNSILLRASLSFLPSWSRSFISQFLQIGRSWPQQDLKLVWFKALPLAQ